MRSLKNRTSEYNKTETDTYREQTGVYQYGKAEVGVGGECRSRRLRGQTYVKIKYSTKRCCVAQGI